MFCVVMMSGQVLVSQIEGLLEVYHPTDSTSIYIGKQAGEATSGISKLNTIVGDRAGRSNTTGDQNSFFGSQAGRDNTTGRQNSVFGYDAGESNTTGNGNSFFGSNAGESNVAGSENSFFGSCAGENNVNGSHNVLIGADSGGAIRDGSNNTAIGHSAGNELTGEGNVIIGSNAGPTRASSARNNSLFIDNEESDQPLIYGDFGDDILRINGQLQIDGTADGNSRLRMQGVGGTFNEVIRYSGSANDVVMGSVSGSGGKLFLRSDGRTQMAMIENGNVGIGTTNPTEALDVRGAATFEDFIRLEPLDQEPFECNSSRIGVVYYDTIVDSLRFCRGDEWRRILSN